MKRVLLVEDDDGIAEIVELILRESGYVVDRVSNVADALDSVQSEAPAAVLLDLTLPGPSGLSFLRTCRESVVLSRLPIALMSASALPTTEDDVVPDAFLSKPFDLDSLCTVVDVLTRDAVSPTGEMASQI